MIAKQETGTRLSGLCLGYSLRACSDKNKLFGAFAITETSGL